MVECCQIRESSSSDEISMSGKTLAIPTSPKNLSMKYTEAETRDRIAKRYALTKMSLSDRA